MFGEFTWDAHTICKAAGLFGSVVYILNYFMLTMRYVSGESVRYFCGNIVASGSVMISLMAEFNLAVLCIQMFFFSASLFAVISRIKGFGGATAKKCRLGTQPI